MVAVAVTTSGLLYTHSGDAVTTAVLAGHDLYRITIEVKSQADPWEGT
jgi:hypothetical protein